MADETDHILGGFGDVAAIEDPSAEAGAERLGVQATPLRAR